MKEMMTKNQEQPSGRILLKAINPDTKQAETVATCELKDGKAVISGNPNFIKQLERGLISQPDQKLVMPDEGEAFLRALKRQFRGAYLFSEEEKPG